MKNVLWKTLSILTVAATLSTIGLVGYQAQAQDDKAAPKKERAKAKGYLPALYKDVVDGVQRDKIYKIQSDYDKQIDALTAQITDLRQKRDSEIAALLTPEQKQRLDELSKAAKVKKDADNKAKASAKNATKEKSGDGGK